jgi:hypothetical protein
MNVFSEIVKGLDWLGKEIVKVGDFLPKVVTLVEDVEADAQTVLPELVTVIDDVGTLAEAVVTDSGACMTAVETLYKAIEAEVSDISSSNLSAAIASAPDVVSAFEAFITEVTTKGTWADVLSAISQLATDYDTLGTSLKTAVAQLEQDA